MRSMSPRVEQAMARLRDFLYEKVYENMEVHADFIRASKVIRDIFERLMEDDELYRELMGEPPEEPGRLRAVADYVAGMSDRYALDLYNAVFLPKPWARM